MVYSGIQGQVVHGSISSWNPVFHTISFVPISFIPLSKKTGIKNDTDSASGIIKTVQSTGYLMLTRTVVT